MVAALEAAAEQELATQLTQLQLELALLLDPQKASADANRFTSIRHPREGGDSGSIDARSAIASGPIHALEGQFPAISVWLGWQANAPDTNASLRFILPKLPN